MHESKIMVFLFFTNNIFPCNFVIKHECYLILRYLIITFFLTHCEILCIGRYGFAIETPHTNLKVFNL